MQAYWRKPLLNRRKIPSEGFRFSQIPDMVVIGAVILEPRHRKESAGEEQGKIMMEATKAGPCLRSRDGIRVSKGWEAFDRWYKTLPPGSNPCQPLSRPVQDAYCTERTFVNV